jgi:hypothetical protein
MCIWSRERVRARYALVFPINPVYILIASPTATTLLPPHHGGSVLVMLYTSPNTILATSLFF